MDTPFTHAAKLASGSSTKTQASWLNGYWFFFKN